MGLKISVNVRGLNKLDELAQLGLQEAVKEESKTVADSAAARAPVLTGALRDSIQAERIGDYAWEVHDGVSYGVYQNYGTHRTAGTGFMTQAFAEAEQRFPERVRDWLRWAAEQAAKEAGI